MKHYLMLMMALMLSVSACKDDPKPPVEPPPSCETDPSLCPPPPPTCETDPSLCPPPPPPDKYPSDAEISALYTTPDSDTERQVFPFVRKFVRDSVDQKFDAVGLFESGPKLRIKIASLDHLGSSVIGLCSQSSSHRTLTVDPDFWNPNSATRKEMLMHHELGHCILDRRHRTAIGVIPGTGHSHQLSIMYPVIFSATQYLDHLGWYLKELFAEAFSEPRPPGTTVDICGPDDMMIEVAE